MLVFHPGELTVRFIGGQRAAFIGPLQLFLWLQAITFAAHTAYFDSDPVRANHKSLALLGLGIWLAVVLWLVGLREKRGFVHSLVVASHFWSFLMVLLLAEYVLAMPLFRLLARGGWVSGEVPVGQWVTVVAMVVMLGHLSCGLRRIYGASIWRISVVLGSLFFGVVVGREYL